MPQIGSLFVNLSMNTAQFAQSSQVAVKSLDNITVNSRKLQFALTNLSFQINDVVTGLATGQAPMRIFAQQAGQIVQLFQQGGGFRAVMGGVTQTIRGFITPVTAATAGVAALAAGVAFLMERAAESQGRVRAFDVMLKGLGATGTTTAEQLEAASKQLRDVGLDAAEAKKAIDSAIRAGVAPSQAGRAARIGQNLIPVLGENAPETFLKALESGAEGSVEALGKLGLRLQVVSQYEIAAAREAAKTGDQMKYLDSWLARIEGRTKGLNEQALSPLAKAFRELRITVSELLDKMSQSDIIVGMVEMLNKLAAGLKYIFELQPPDWFNRLMGVFPGGQKPGDVAYAPIPPAGAATGGGGGSGAGSAGSGGATQTDRALDIIERFESGGRNIKNPTSTASGYWQFINGTWREVAPQAGVDINQFPTAMSASREDQRRAAALLYEQRGFQPWTVGNPKLAAFLTGGGFAAGGGAAGGAAATGGSMFARPGDPQAGFLGTRAAELPALMRGTAQEIAYQEYLAQATRAGRVARGGAEAQAGQERAQRYPGELRFTPQAEAELAKRTEQFLQLTQARGRLSLAQGGQQDRQTTEQLKLQASLFGQSAEAIERQVDLLKVRQQAEQAGLDVTDEAVQKRMEETKALSDANIVLAKQRGLMEEIRGIAGVFENTFSQAFDSIADGTFNLRKTMNSLFRDLGKTIASSAFKRLIEGEPGGTGGILGSITGLFGLGGGSSQYDFSSLDMPAFAGGGSFRVGGYGAMDSQLVSFRASPGEMVDVSPPGMTSGGGGEIIRIDLNPSEGWVAGVADQRIVTRSGQIVDVAVRQSSRTVQRNFAGMSAEANARQM